MNGVSLRSRAAPCKSRGGASISVPKVSVIHHTPATSVYGIQSSGGKWQRATCLRPSTAPEISRFRRVGCDRAGFKDGDGPTASPKNIFIKHPLCIHGLCRHVIITLSTRVRDTPRPGFKGLLLDSFIIIHRRTHHQIKLYISKPFINILKCRLG